MTRIALNKKEIHSEFGAILLAMLQEITSDGRLSQEEITELNRLLESEQAKELVGAEHLKSILQQVLSDGKISELEKKLVYDSIEKVLPQDIRSFVKVKRKEAILEDKASIEADKIAYADFIVAGSFVGSRTSNIHKRCAPGKSVYLKREPYNPYDKNAIMVIADNSYQIGYVPKEYSKEIASIMDKGCKYSAKVKKNLGDLRNLRAVILAEFFNIDSKIEGLNSTSDNIFGIKTGDPNKPQTYFTPPIKSDQISNKSTNSTNATNENNKGINKSAFIYIILALILLTFLALIK